MEVYLCDLVNHDGSFWEACARSQLKSALADLERAGFTLQVGFEQECFIYGLADRVTPAFSLAGSRTVSALSGRVFDTLATAGTRLDQFMAEYGEHQYEVAGPVRPALRAADEAVIVREVVRDAARLAGAHATFAPKPDLAAPGSGVHIHMSLWDGDGVPVTAAGDGLTATSGAFVAGILKHLDAVMAYTTPSPNSFDRLRPSSWVGVFKCFGIRNREAAVRLAPRPAGHDGTNPAASLEFRVADGAANPYLALAAVVRAGLDGIRQGLPAPRTVDRDPAKYAQAEREAMGIDPLVPSLTDAMAAAEPLADAWFGPVFWSAYDPVQRNEMADAEKAADYPSQLARVI
jgi:glutamine synthetase